MPQEKPLSGSIVLAATIGACFTGATILWNDGLRQGLQTGLLLCGQVLIPALFPFLTLCEWLSQSGAAHGLGKLLRPLMIPFGLPGEAGMTVLLSFLGGYPVGARGSCELYRQGFLSRRQAIQICCFGVNAGPAFVLTAVAGGMLHRPQIGGWLLACQMTASLLLGILVRFLPWKDRSHSERAALVSAVPLSDAKTCEPPSAADAFVNATAHACSAILTICGFALIFSGCLGMMKQWNWPTEVIRWVGGGLEVTTGCALWSDTNHLPMICAVIGFGGCSVFFQILSVCRFLHPPTGLLFGFRLLHGGLSYLLMWGVCKLFPTAVAAFHTHETAMAIPFTVSLPASLSVSGLCFLFLLFLSGKKRLVIGEKV